MWRANRLHLATEFFTSLPACRGCRKCSFSEHVPGLIIVPHCISPAGAHLFVQNRIQQCLVLFERWELSGHARCTGSFPLCVLRWTIMFVFLSTGPAVSELVVVGEVGQDVTVPCRYSVRDRIGITSMCWGRDRCPNSKCSRPIIWTDGWRVTEQHSSRYQLKGDLHAGDVSLTIVDAREADSGIYCCRVEVPGWFNDQLINYKVVITKGECRGMLLCEYHCGGSALGSGLQSLWCKWFLQSSITLILGTLPICC